MNKSYKDTLALALDNVDTREEIDALIRATHNWIGVYKIGLEQFIRFGPPIIDLVRQHNGKIFLDLKLHDIPNTVAKAVSAACDLAVDYLTLHTQGGIAMMRAAVQAKAEHAASSKPLLLGVTLLTSIGADALRDECKVSLSVAAYVKHLAQTAADAGLGGIVCSAADLSDVIPYVPASFAKVTPGIRPSGTNRNDQKRVATPAAALSAGATLLVLGRAVTAADNPEKAAEAIYNEVASAQPATFISP